MTETAVLGLMEGGLGYTDKEVIGGKGKTNDIEDKEQLMHAATEMESVFTYELLKVMRQAHGNPFGNNTGSDTYLSMFDLELSKYISETGLGLKDMLVRQLSKFDDQDELVESKVINKTKR